MDDSSIAVRTDKLHREIELIQQDEHRYRNQQNHSLVDQAAHIEREQRMFAIRAELRSLVEKAKQQSSHGAVWYS